MKQKIYRYEAIRSFTIAEMRKSTLRNTKFRKKCSENVQQSYRRTPVPKCDFNKVCKAFFT